MTIRKYNNPMTDLNQQPFSAMLDRLFNESVQNRSRLNQFTPSVDVTETEQGFEFEIALPGVKKEAINIDFQEGRLTISGERKFDEERKNRNYHFIETQYGAFTRSFMLPDNVKADAIEARFEDGLLLITVPKDEKKVMKHQIAVK